MSPSEDVGTLECNVLMSYFGPLVIYCLADGPNRGQYRPAIIVRAWGDLEQEPPPPCNLVVFVDGENDGYSRGMCTIWKTSVTYAEESKPGSYRWEPMLEAPNLEEAQP